MALVSDIQLQTSAVKPPILDTSQKFSAEGLTATTAFALTDAGAGTTVSTTGQFTAKSANDLTAWFQSTLTDGDAEIYISNDARPDWSLKVSGTAGDNFLISNSCSADGTIQGTALSITPAGAVGFGKYGATDALEINALNSVSAAIVITNATQGVSNRMKTESASSSFGTTTNHKIGFMTNATTRGVFDTSGNFGIGTDAPGALLDVRGSVIFNEGGGDYDVRMEGDTCAELFHLDASTDRIGIGTATPAVLLDVDNGGATSQLLMCVNGCICAAGYMGEKRGHTIETAGVALTQRTGLNFVVTDVGTVTDDSSNDATVVCISGANTCVPFLLCDGSTSDPISLVGGSIGNALSNDSTPTLGGLMCGDGNNICAVCCICITGCYFGDGSNLTGVSSVPGCYSGDCTIIGCSAGGNVAAGATNIVLYGANAGYNVTTADNIVAIGSSVVLCMTTATDQVIIGTNAGRCVLTCAGNVVVGAHAFYNECAGSYNTVIGNCAGLTQKGATTNTFIGALAGALDSTGSGNVFVGYKAGCANTTGSCCLIIGNGTCDIIVGDFSSGAVGIGTATPDARLTVHDAGTTHDHVLGIRQDDYSTFGLIIGNDLHSTNPATGGFRIMQNDTGFVRFSNDGTANFLIIDTSGNISTGSDGTGHDILFYSDTVGKSWLWDQSADKMIVTGDASVSGTLCVSGDFSVGTTTYNQNTITKATGGPLNIALSSAAGDDFTVDTDKFTVEGDTGNVGIGTATPNAPLTVQVGILSLGETTTPTATTNYGKVYTKTDNKLYFQDGAGSEHELAFA